MESFLYVVVISGNSTTVVFLEGLLTLSNVYDKVKIFEIIELKKPRGNLNFFSGTNVPGKSLA